MNYKLNRPSWAYAALIVSTLLTACQQPGEDFTDRKRRENEAEIEQYIQQNNLTATKTEQGIYFVQTKSIPTAQAPKTGDEVRYHFIARRLDGVIVDSTDIAGNNPATVILAESGTTGITLGRYEGILRLRQGEEGFVLAPAYSDGGRTGTLLLPQYSPVRYDLRIVSVRTENQQIQNYITTNNLTVTTLTTDSVRVIKTLVQPADSMAITTGKTVTLNYTGKLLNGTVFESYSTTTRQVQVGTRQVPPGLENSLTSLRAGEKAYFLVPSAAGYGTVRASIGNVSIPPYSPLIYEITVVKVQ